VPPASPSTYIEIGTVASETSGASAAPTMAPVAKITAALAPVSACAAARRATLARARASPDAPSAAVISIIFYFYPMPQGYLDRCCRGLVDSRIMKARIHLINRCKWRRASRLGLSGAAEHQCEIVGRHLRDLEQ